MSVMSEQSTVQPPASAAEALALVAAGLSFLASADATELSGDEQADALRGLGRAESMHLAATSRVLTAFGAGRGFEADGARSARSWLRWQTQISGAAAGSAWAWAQRLAGHPLVAAALAAGTISPSYARVICELCDRLPADRRDEGDQILLGAVADGAVLRDLPSLVEHMLSWLAPDSDDGDDRFTQRRLRLLTHYRGWATLEADLTPAAAQALRAVLDAHGTPAGPEDQRTQEQRDHDVLAEVCEAVVAGGLPDRAGQPTQIQLHMTLDQLLQLPGADAATSAWAAQAPAPPGADCDASIVPVVTGHLDQQTLAELATARLADLATRGTGHATNSPGPDDCSSQASGSADGVAARSAAQLIIRDAVRLLSGPGGLAGYLRTGLLTGPAASISLPLDVGRPTDTIPAHLRRAVIARDRHCTFPGCDIRAARCHVHHLVPRSEGGPTALDNCALLCAFHHLIAIHTWGWTLLLQPDGTTVATSPDGTKVLRSHAPPTAA